MTTLLDVLLIAGSFVYMLYVFVTIMFWWTPIRMWAWRRLPLSIESRWKYLERSVVIKHKLLNVRFELRPFALVAIPIYFVAYNVYTDDTWGWRIWSNVGIVIWWFIAYFCKDKNDRWKKRRKKALARVKEAAGKLVVVPQPAPVNVK